MPQDARTIIPSLYDVLALKQTPAEIAAGVTPVNYAYVPGDVRRYGADPTGVNDSTIALQSAINVCKNANGANAKFVDLRDGTYKVTSTITIVGSFGTFGILIQGNRATINFSQNAACFQFDAQGTAPQLRMNAYLRGVTITGPGISQASSACILISGTGNVTANVYLYDCLLQTAFYGVQMTNSLSSYFDKCTMQFNQIGFSSVFGAQTNANNIILSRCTIISNGQAIVGNTFPNACQSFIACDIEGNSTPTSLTFSSAPGSGATSATLASNFTGSTLVYPVAFNSGEIRMVTLTNGATTATWTGGLSSNETTAATYYPNDICSFTTAGEVTFLACHFEANLGVNGVTFNGADQTKTITFEGCENIATCGNVVQIANGYCNLIGGRLFNSSAVNNLFLNASTAYAYISGAETLVSGTGVVNALWAAEGGFMAGANGQGAASGHYGSIGPPSGLWMTGQADTLTITMKNGTGTRINYLQSVNGADMAWVAQQAFGHVFYASNTTVFRAGRSGAQTIEPGTDNSVLCGSGSLAWSGGNTHVAFTVVSDGRLKQQVDVPSAAEIATAKAVKSLLRKFKFNSAVEKKGSDARIHFGVIAQDVAAAFTANGLDPAAYGMFCHDTWDAHEEQHDGQIVMIAAGDRYGIRYEELLAFVLAAL